MEFTKREYRQFYHGISMSLLSKKSAQKWRYDDETAEEIRFLEGLESKVLDKIRQADTPQPDMAEDIVKSYGVKAESYRQAKAKTEPQTDCSWGEAK